MRNPTTFVTILALGLAGGTAMAGAGAARACEDPGVLALAAAETPATPTQAPAAPRPPRVRRAPDAPAPVETPKPAAAPEARLEIPEPPALVTPRGWFGFGFQCGECYAKTEPGDSIVVWSFGSPPRVYSVDTGSPAARAGLRRGDEILKIDGISILTPEGGRRFGSVRPGQTVKWTVAREGAQRQVIARAAERPDRRERTQLRDLRRDLERLNEMSDLDQLRKEIAMLNREMERMRLQDLDRLRVRTLPARRLRYAGVIGGSEVEVRGPGSVIVSESEDKGEVVINIGESVVVIRAPEARARRAADGPK
jgi:hypothetical protein